MTPPIARPALDLAAVAVRAFVLYSLAEFQSGHVRTLRVTKQGPAFGIQDDGRGHPLDKALEGTSYLRFIYTHFDYPFDAARPAPVQLQGIGMSVVNAMCAALTLTVRKPGERLVATFRHGRLDESRVERVASDETGITIDARLAEGLPVDEDSVRELEAWLRSLVRVHPALQLYLNGALVQPDAASRA